MKGHVHPPRPILRYFGSGNLERRHSSFTRLADTRTIWLAIIDVGRLNLLTINDHTPPELAWYNAIQNE